MKSKDIFNDIVEDILAFELISGTRLPSEQILAQKYNCNRHTIRKAIDQLVSHGYLLKEFGCSPIVKGVPSEHSLQLSSFYDLHPAGDISSHIILFEKITSSPELQQVFYSKEPIELWHFIRNRFVNNILDHIENVFMPVRLFNDFSIQKCNNSVLSYIENEMNYVISHSEKTISGVLVSDISDTYIAKQLVDRELTIQIEATGFLTNGRVYEYSICYHLDNKINFFAKR